MTGYQIFLFGSLSFFFKKRRQDTPGVVQRAYLVKGGEPPYGTHPAPADSQWEITFED